MIARRDVFQAIADPSRRAIISLIAAKPQNVNSIAENFDVSRQAISLHIKVLIDCGLVDIKKEGRDHVCEAKLSQLAEVSLWVDQYKQHFEQKLDALETYIKKIKNKRHGKTKK
jgi:DNA-binding transcriptional ArsR family regulator